MKRKIFLGVATLLVSGLFALVIFSSQQKINTMLYSISELESRIEDYRKETEENKLTIYELSKANDSLTNDLDSARQEHIELEREISEIENRKQQLINSRGNLKAVEFVTTQNITKATITDGALLDLGLQHKLKGLGPAFVRAGLKYGVDPLFLAAIAVQESGWGRYDHGNNNIFGINSGAKYFNSYEECIDYAANLLSKYYIAEGRTTPALIQPKYCPSPTNWHYKVADCANTILKNI